MVYCDLRLIVNYDDGLLYLWHIIMPVMMFYCELSWFFVNWEGSVIVKKGGLGRFAECNTRQKDELPNVKAKHSAKRPFSVILGTLYAECFGFDECISMDTRQSDHKIWPLLACLPSVLGMALGKVSKLCRVSIGIHSAKFTNFAECFRLDTQQTWKTLPSVFVLTLGKVEKLCRVFYSWHSVNLRNFAEYFSVVHSAKSTSPFHPVKFFFAECLLTLGKLFAECPIKNTRQTTVCRQINAVCCMPSVTLGKAFAGCFWAFAECFWHSTNLLYPVVDVCGQILQWVCWTCRPFLSNKTCGPFKTGSVDVCVVTLRKRLCKKSFIVVYLIIWLGIILYILSEAKIESLSS